MFEEKRMPGGGRCFIQVLEALEEEPVPQGNCMEAAKLCDEKTQYEPPALRERVGRELRRVELAAAQRNRIGELYALLEMNPDVARILELREQLGL